MTPTTGRVLSLLVVLLSLAGCEGYGEDATRKELLKLAFRTSQLQEALERCNAPAQTLGQHDKAWKDNFDAAAAWLGVAREQFTDRQQAGREALTDDASVGCDVVQSAVPTSLAAAQRWAGRIARRELCTPLGCE